MKKIFKYLSAFKYLSVLYDLIEEIVEFSNIKRLWYLFK